ncbi:zinc metalloproteinase nas-14-like [Penaeus japonicus]|uniref:zinc metalloproteinase nas-14-like n=1 Tax=Penaeus japonicus TaxID=27405 RepID=UPI001C70D54B|nr:zinc metalloproteinase nas-14-like [Penaeus japonicus]
MAITDNHRLWPGGRLPYKIDFDPLEHVNAYNILMSAINRINAEKCVNLMEAGNQSKDYVSIQLGDYLSSHLGRQGGQQLLTFSDNANWGTIMHEFMHTLGFGHEHNRPDRDEYVEVYFDNIQDAAKPYFKRYGPESGISGDFAPYDYTSLMHATNQHREDINIDITKPVIERLDGQENLGQRDHLTEGDKARMRIVYSCGMCKDPSNESMLFRYPGNCNMYYQCAQGQAVPRQCPQNLHFSESKDRCDYANEANCTFAGLV